MSTNATEIARKKIKSTEDSENLQKLQKLQDANKFACSEDNNPKEILDYLLRRAQLHASPSRPPDLDQELDEQILQVNDIYLPIEMRNYCHLLVRK